MDLTLIDNTPSPNKIISSLGNQVTVYFETSINLDPKKKFAIEVVSADIMYCMPNVDQTNNTLSYITADNVTHVMTFEIGLYYYQDINYQIALFCQESANGGDASLIQFEPDEGTSKMYVYFDSAHISIDCTPATSIMNMLGFPPSMGTIGNLSSPGYVKSVNMANLNSIHNILIKANCTQGSYHNSQTSNIISVVTPNVDSFSVIQHRPLHLIPCSLRYNNLDYITITLTDQNDDDVDMGTQNGTLAPQLWSVQFVIVEIK